MPRYQVPCYVCVDAENMDDARARVARDIRSNFTENTFFYQDELLPIMDVADGADDPSDLEDSVRCMLGE